MAKLWRGRIASAITLGFHVSFVQAQSSNPLALGNQGIYEKSLAALTLLFVVAVLLESAFSTIFNWRVFLAYFSRTGIKTIVMVIVSLVIVNAFDLDIVASLVSAYKPTPEPSGPLSRFVTALILAGGSDGVYNIMRALGYRSGNREAESVARPPLSQAWVSVRVRKLNAVGEVQIKIRSLGPVATYVGVAPLPIAGTITFNRRPLADLLLRRVNRFPQSGGYVLSPDVVYELSCEGVDGSGSVIPSPPVVPTRFSLAPGAIVDFSVTL